MKLSIDREADALYLRLDETAIVESEEVSPGVVLDYNRRNEVVGVEMLNLSKRSTAPGLSSLQFETFLTPDAHNYPVHRGAGSM